MNFQVIIRYFLARCFIYFVFLVIPFSQVMVAQSIKSELVTLHAKNQSIENTFREISRQTGLKFFYGETTVNKKINVNLQFEKTPIKTVLEAISTQTGLSFNRENNTISVSANPKLESTGGNQSGLLRKVTGIVTDEKNEPIIGVNIIVQGTPNNGTITDIDGRFSLEAKDGDNLVFSYIGYLSKSMKISKGNVSVQLVEDSQKLDEVVIVGYGTQKKANLTGSVESIKSDRISSKPVSTLAQALAGEAAGVTITQNSGQPKADQGQIRIRGVGTWENADPLVLVDGIAMSIKDVVPTDVESVTVLKDAASASIYGSRAANGVVLITTKKGKEGKVSFNYTGNFGVQTPTRTPRMAESWQYAELYNQSMANEGKSSSLFPQDRIDRMKQGGDPDKLEGNTDWYGELLQPAIQHSHNITVTGGSDKVSYMGSLGYSDQQGVVPSTAYKRYNARVNTTSNITSWFKLGINIAYINNEETDTSAGATGASGIDDNGGAYNAFQKIARAVPYMPVRYSDGTWSYLSAPTNPIRMVTDDYGNRRRVGNNVSTLISPEFNPIEGLNIKGVFAYESNTYKKKQFEKIVKYEAFEPSDQTATTVVPRNQQTDKWEQYNNLTASATASYEKQLNKHYFKVMAGGSLETFKYAYTKASRKDFPNNDFTDINAGDPNTASAEGNSTYSSLASVFGRLNYVLADRYLFEANLRYDGSSKFAKGKRFGLFPSFSVGWRISEEAFFDHLKTYIPSLKVRASWGQLGNQQIKDYQYYSTFGSGGNYLFNNVLNTGYKETLMGNPDITWETSRNLNLGIDFSLVNNKLQLTFDWYKRMTDDILLALKAPATLGITPPMQNAGSVENKGWDLTVSWRDKIGADFNYSVGFNLSDVKNKITDLKGYKSPTDDLTTRIEGEPIDAIFGWESLGICADKEQYDRYKEVMLTYNANWNIGDIIINDRNNDGKIGADDKTVIGNSIPRFGFGLNLAFDYKNFDFSCFFQGVCKLDGYVTEELIRPMGIYSARKDHYTDSFNPANPNPDAYYPRVTNSWAYNYANMSHWTQDAAYLRLKNLQLGYTFNLHQIGIEKLRVMVSGQNLFTLTKFKVWDPETKVGSRSTYPNVATYSLGVNLVF